MAYPGIPAAPPGTNIFGARLGVNPKRDLTAALSGPAAGGILSEKFMRGLNGERTKIFSKNTPVTAPKPGETAYPNLLNEMGFHTSTSAPEQARRATPSTIYNTEKKANTTIPQFRNLHVANGATLADLPGEDDICFIKKTRLAGAVAFKTTSDARDNKLEDYTSLTRGNAALVNTHPLIGYHHIALAAALHGQLGKLATKDLPRYQTLTMREIMQGVDDLGWTGWTLDGVVMHEQDEQRHSTAPGDQYSAGRFAGGMQKPGFSSQSKILTVAQVGQQDMVDVFGSRGLQEGASLWCVVRKYNPGPNSRPEGITYIKSRKAKVLEQGGASATTVIPHYDLTIDGKKVRMHPPGFFFVADPTGGELDPSFAVYEDEWGEKQMGAILSLGRVMFLPARFKQQSPPITSPDSPFFRAQNDGLDVLIRDHLTVILPTHHDGHLSLV